MRVVRVFHGARHLGNRARERALSSTGVELTLVVPAVWSDAGSERVLSPDDFEVIELPVQRSGDVNRHRYAEISALTAVLERVKPDLVDVQEEPVSLACRQWLRAVGGVRPVVGYTAQNVDKRFPPPFAQYEQQALGQLSALYPCSRQAAAVARGKGFAGLIHVLPLGIDAARQAAGTQSATDEEIVLGLVGRLVQHKGVRDAVRVLHRLRQHRQVRLVVVGEGPEQQSAEALAAELGVADAVEFLPWQGPQALADLYRSMHVVLVPSTATQTWVEQFGRVIVEGQAAGALVAGYASGAIPEVAGAAGMLAPEHDVDALAQRVAAVLADPVDFRRRRQAGLSAAAAVTWATIARRHIAFYEASLRAGGPAPARAASREQRLLAEQEFGPPATLAGSALRPFALPVLRRDSPVTRRLGAALDRVTGG